MRKIDVELEFTQADSGKGLYDDDNLDNNWSVDARYVRRLGYEKDPDVCCIPPLPDTKRLMRFFTVDTGICDWETVSGMTKQEKYESISQMNHVMVPLGLHLDVAKALHNVVLSSYKGRQVMITDTDRDTPLSKKGLSGRVESIRKQEAPRPEGFYIHGNSGMGKSVALGLARRMYPRAVRVTTGDFSYSVIPIIFVTALCNQVSDVYRSIAAQIDEILDTGDYHENQVVNKSLTKAQGYIKKWIKLYHIGCIIIDEIQFLRSTSTSKGLEDLIGITAETGCGFGLIGNNDSCPAVLDNPRILGRVGRNKINADIRTVNTGKLFDRAMRTLWDYQWTDVFSPFSDEIKEYLLTESGGNIGLLKAVLARIQLMAVQGDIKEPLTVEKIRGYIGDMTVHMRDLLNKHTAEEDRRFEEVILGVYGEADAEAKRCREESLDTLLSEWDAGEKKKAAERKKREVAKAVSTTQGCSYDKALIAVNAAIDGWPGLLDAPDSELARKAAELLKPAKPKKRAQRKPTVKVRSAEDKRKLDAAAQELLAKAGGQAV